MGEHPQTTMNLGPPIHVNEIGTKFWVDVSLSKYARQKNLHGIALDYHVLFAETVDGHMSRLLVDSVTNDVLYDTQSLEAMSVHIDMVKAAKHYDGLEEITGINLD